MPAPIPNIAQIRGVSRTFSPFDDDILTRHELYEPFLQQPAINADITIATNRDFEVLGTNAVSASVTFGTNGGIVMTTAGAATDSVIILPHLDTTQTVWAKTFLPNGQPKWECMITIPTALTNKIIWAGLKLTNTATVATDNDQAFFRYEGSVSAFWQAITSVGNVDTTTTSTVTVAISTKYRLTVTIGSDKKPRMYINGVLIVVGSAFAGTEALIPYVGILSKTDATAKALNLFYEKASRLIP